MQLRKTETKVIGEDVYEITQLGAIKGRAVLVRVLKVLGPAFAGGDISKLFEAIKEEDLEYLCNQFAPLTMVQGKGQLDQIFDTHFTGRYMDMMRWLGACLMLNFDQFLKGFKATAAMQALAVDPASPSASVSPKA